MYVCTTAEREYAFEAWRQLDPQGSLFPLEQLSWRMLCVSTPQKKDLLNVLRKRDIDVFNAAREQSIQAGIPVPPLLPNDLQLITDEGGWQRWCQHAHRAASAMHAACSVVRGARAATRSHKDPRVVLAHPSVNAFSMSACGAALTLHIACLPACVVLTQTVPGASCRQARCR